MYMIAIISKTIYIVVFRYNVIASYLPLYQIHIRNLISIDFLTLSLYSLVLLGFLKRVVLISFHNILDKLLVHFTKISNCFFYNYRNFLCMMFVNLLHLRLFEVNKSLKMNMREQRVM